MVVQWLLCRRCDCESFVLTAAYLSFACEPRQVIDTYVCLAEWFDTCHMVVMLCSWEGRRRYGVALVLYPAMGSRPTYAR